MYWIFSLSRIMTPTPSPPKPSQQNLRDVHLELSQTQSGAVARPNY
jgi:hypothetical protein